MKKTALEAGSEHTQYNITKVILLEIKSSHMIMT